MVSSILQLHDCIMHMNIHCKKHTAVTQVIVKAHGPLVYVKVY